MYFILFVLYDFFRASTERFSDSATLYLASYSNDTPLNMELQDLYAKKCKKHNITINSVILHQKTTEKTVVIIKSGGA